MLPHIALVAVLMFLLPTLAHAERRVALVIGNGAYTGVGKLANPARDADAFGALLQAARFDIVEVKNDLGAVTMRRALRDFSDRVRAADIALVFYAGHGIEVNGTNYLIPVDAVLERDIDVEDETVSLDRVIQILEPAKRLRLVILDACRDNPFLRSMKRTVTGRSIGRGLAKVDVLTSDTLVAFAAKAGMTAADGEGANSPYTTALVKHLTIPGLDLRLALGRVRDEVIRGTANKQEPFLYGSLGGAEIALVPAVRTEVQPRAAPHSSLSEAAEAWDRTKESASIGALEAFVTRYGDTFYADLANLRIRELKATLAEKERAEERRKREDAKVASLPTDGTTLKAPERPAMVPPALAQALQTELRRVGCDPGSVDGKWGPKAREALDQFVRLTNTSVPRDEPSEAALQAVSGRKDRVCPLTCRPGESQVDGKCIAKAKPKAPAPGNGARAAKAEPERSRPRMCWTGQSAAQILGPCTGSPYDRPAQ
jgi:uncharacterized caspase-like protein